MTIANNNLSLASEQSVAVVTTTLADLAGGGIKEMRTMRTAKEVLAGYELARKHTEQGCWLAIGSMVCGAIAAAMAIILNS